MFFTDNLMNQTHGSQPTWRTWRTWTNEKPSENLEKAWTIVQNLEKTWTIVENLEKTWTMVQNHKNLAILYQKQNKTRRRYDFSKLPSRHWFCCFWSDLEKFHFNLDKTWRESGFFMEVIVGTMKQELWMLVSQLNYLLLFWFTSCIILQWMGMCIETIILRRFTG